MSISATTGKTANNSSATTTLAFTATSITAGQDIVVAIAIADTTQSVSGIADTASNTFTRRAYVANGSSVRTEIWEAQNVLGNGSDIITITFSGATLAAAVFEEYAGILSQSVTVWPTDYAPHNMTTNSAPSPYVASASSTYGGTSRPPYQAFNGDYVGGEGYEWLGTGGGTDWLQIDLGTAQTVNGYSITIVNSSWGPARAPKTWTLRGSNDNFATYTVVDTIASQTSWAAGEKRTFTVASPGSYRYYRLNITANNGDFTYTCVLEMNLWGGTGVSLGAQNTGTGSATDTYPHVRVTTQEAANWAAAALGFACSSGDTFTAVDGTIRQYVVPALTSVGVALVDVAALAPAVSLSQQTRLSASRAWAAAAVELRSGGNAAGSYYDYQGALPLQGTPLTKDIRMRVAMPTGGGSALSELGLASQQLRDGVVGVSYTDTLVSIGGSTPYAYAVSSGSLPGGLSLSSGVISGTPTTAGTSSFDITVTDAHGRTATRTFSVVVSAGGSGGSFAYLG